MNALSRFDTNSLAQLNRALLGFDGLFEEFGNRALTSTNYPPYNVAKYNDNLYDVIVAVAGFAKDEISVEVDNNRLIIRGEKNQEFLDAEPEYLHRGLAFRNFERIFTLAEHMKVVKAETKNGLLVIQLERQVPEALLPRKINIVEL